MRKNGRRQSLNPKLGISPKGVLLDFGADLSRDFGFAYERFLNFQKGLHDFPRFTFCAVRGSCVSVVTEKETGRKFVNSKSTCVFKGPNTFRSLVCDQTVYENLVFMPTTERMYRAFLEAGYQKSDWKIVHTGIKEIPRSEWFNSLVERYFNRRLFAPSDTTQLEILETEILREVLVMVLGEPSRQRDKPSVVSPEHSTPFRRAIESIEMELFSKLDLQKVAKSAGLSRPTLVRLFKRELCVSPMAYVRQRKLEEAKRLLSKKNHSVTEISYLVGYDDTSAFCRAYKSHFGVSPSTLD